MGALLFHVRPGNQHARCARQASIISALPKARCTHHCHKMVTSKRSVRDRRKNMFIRFIALCLINVLLIPVLLMTYMYAGNPLPCVCLCRTAPNPIVMMPAAAAATAMGHGAMAVVSTVRPMQPMQQVQQMQPSIPYAASTAMVHTVPSRALGFGISGPKVSAVALACTVFAVTARRCGRCQCTLLTHMI